MNSDNLMYGFAVFAVSLMLGLIIGLFIAAAGTQAHYEAEAIKHGAAGYDSVTGEWKWKQKEIK